MTTVMQSKNIVFNLICYKNQYFGCSKLSEEHADVNDNKTVLGNDNFNVGQDQRLVYVNHC